jgi:hypothetical protein
MLFSHLSSFRNLLPKKCGGTVTAKQKPGDAVDRTGYTGQVFRLVNSLTCGRFLHKDKTDLHVPYNCEAKKVKVVPVLN